MYFKVVLVDRNSNPPVHMCMVLESEICTTAAQGRKLKQGDLGACKNCRPEQDVHAFTVLFGKRLNAAFRI